MEPAVDLSQLRDIHLPADVSWWPPALGWWMLTGLIILILFGLYWWYRHWSNQQWRRDAIAELVAIQQSGSPYEQLTQLNILIRRVMMQCHDRDKVASLTGEQWLTKLEQQGIHLGNDHGLLMNAPYMKAGNVDHDINLTELTDTIRRWIESVPESAHRSVVLR